MYTVNFWNEYEGQPTTIAYRKKFICERALQKHLKRHLDITWFSFQGKTPKKFSWKPIETTETLNLTFD